MDVKRRNEKAMEIATPIVKAGIAFFYKFHISKWGEVGRGAVLGDGITPFEMSREIEAARVPLSQS